MSGLCISALLGFGWYCIILQVFFLPLLGAGLDGIY